MTEGRKFYGKYRGTVVDNLDPELRGRLIVEVPGVLTLMPTTWAEACVPLSGPPELPMGVYMVPMIGAAVWVEFEHGDANKPIWVGCQLPSTADVPDDGLAGVPADPSIVLQSLLKHKIVISDLPPTPITGGIVLKSLTGATLVINDSGIYLDNGKGATITLVGPVIDMNNGTLTLLS